MAVGEFVSVSQQADMEEADIATERDAQTTSEQSRLQELEELVQIYVDRGLPEDLARQVAEVSDCTAYCAITIDKGADSEHNEL
jgi:vacuolar iron transporter family protein